MSKSEASLGKSFYDAAQGFGDWFMQDVIGDSLGLVSAVTATILGKVFESDPSAVLVDRKASVPFDPNFVLPDSPVQVVAVAQTQSRSVASSGREMLGQLEAPSLPRMPAGQGRNTGGVYFS